MKDQDLTDIVYEFGPLSAVSIGSSNPAPALRPFQCVSNPSRIPALRDEVAGFWVCG